MLLSVILAAAMVVWGQSSGSTTASLTGAVTDETGSVIPGVTVKAKNIETNLIRDSSTNENGTYLITQLPPGNYEITTTAEGFSTQTSRLELTLGTTSRLNFTMSIGTTSDIVEVTTTNVIEEAKTESSTNIDRQRIEALPINRRNFLDFSLTSPRVTADRVPAQGAAATSGLSFNGQNGRVNNITVDGLDNNDFGTGSVRATFGQDAVQEFQVVSDSYSAEFGRALGGVVNIVTKGGGNDVHGSLFFLNRNDSIAARDVFAPFKPEFKQYQFGSAVGGPIKKDKAFFFLSFERLSIKQNNFVTISDDTIAAANRNGFQSVNGPVPFSVGSTSVLARTDFRIGANDTLWVRYTYNGTFDGRFEPFGGLVAQSNGGTQNLQENSVALNNTYFNTKLNLTNETRFIYGRRNQAVDPNDDGPQIRITAPEGVDTFGRSTFSPQPRQLRVYQIVNNVSITKGRQSIKFGVDFNYTNTPNLKTEVPVFGGGFALFLPIDFAALGGIPGLPTFTGLQAFDPASRTPAEMGFLNLLAAQLPSIAPGFPAGVPLNQLSLPSVYVQGFGDPRLEVAAKLFSVFYQDDIKVKPNLTIKAGIRYDINRVRFVPDNDGNISPRVGIAYRPTKLPKLNLHASYGLFFAAPVTGPSFVIGRDVINQLTLVQIPFPFSILPFAQPGHHFPDSVGVPPGVTFTPQLSQTFSFDKNTKNGYTEQTSFGFDYFIGNNTAISVSYQNVRGVKLLSQRDINPIVRPNGNPVTSAEFGRVDTTAGSEIQFSSSFDSFFNGLTVSVNRKLTNHFGFLANYTYSKSIDDFIDLRADLSEVENPLNIGGERGLSLQDVRNRFVLSGTWDLNYTKNKFLKDFQLSSIVTLTNGRPFNLITGADTNMNGDFPPGDRPEINGTPVARNAGITPGFANVDLRLTRAIMIKEKVRIQGIAECFNLFNRVNISDLNRIYPQNPDGSFDLPPQNGGRFIATKDRFVGAFSPRQFQLGFRVSF
jgi:hypothetical protein